MSLICERLFTSPVFSNIIILSVDFKSPPWAQVGLELGHLQCQGSSVLSILVVPSTPPSSLLTGFLSSRAGAGGGEGGAGRVPPDYAVVTWLWQIPTWRELRAIALRVLLLGTGLLLLLVTNYSSLGLALTAIFPAGCPLAGPPLCPSKPIATFCTHSTHKLVLTGPL